MFEPHFTSKFKKDYKKADKNPLRNIEDLDQIISKLVLGESLESKYRDHALKGDFLGCRECHIYPDWLLIYILDHDVNIITFVRLGSHSELF